LPQLAHLGGGGFRAGRVGIAMRGSGSTIEHKASRRSMGVRARASTGLERASHPSSAARVPRKRADKFNERRMELAEAALTTLSQLGYSRTSLREIAENSDFSHGVLHYYFADKVDLITCCVRLYKARCATRYDRLIAQATTYATLLDGFLEVFGATLRDESRLHRLWYDLRSQALYDPAFRADVAAIDQSLQTMIWRVTTRFAELSGCSAGITAELAYAIFDGLFQHGLIKHLSGDAGAIAELQHGARLVLERLYGEPSAEGNEAKVR
jgi:AcrR family transcriptional regulator